MRATLGLLFFISIRIQLFGQPDCKILFTYSGTVEIGANENLEIGLPTTPFLLSYTKEKEERSFYFTKLTPNLNETLISHLSSDFCMNYEMIIEKVFKGENDFYLFKVRRKNHRMNKNFETKDIKIPIDSLKFEYNKAERKIIIHLPTIKAEMN